MIELFALILSLVLGNFQTSLSTLSHLILRSQLYVELLVLLLSGSQGPVGLGTEVGLNSSVILGILDPLLSHKNLLDSLHINNRGVREKKRKKERKTLLVKYAKELTKARSLFRDKKRSGCLMCFKASMSLGSKRGRSRASAM